jgi:putative addiction module component (TIGR02574 family)
MVGTMSNEELRSAALGLPREERADLAHALLVSLHGDADTDAADAWVAELARRASEVADGSVKLVDWDVARERIADGLKARRANQAPR